VNVADLDVIQLKIAAGAAADLDDALRHRQRVAQGGDIQVV